MHVTSINYELLQSFKSEKQMEIDKSTNFQQSSTRLITKSIKALPNNIYITCFPVMYNYNPTTKYNKFGSYDQYQI